MKYLIVGVNGFIGSHVLNYFLHNGVQAYGCATHGAENHELFVVDKFDPDFNSIFRANEFDVCINAAGSSGVGYSIQEPEKDYILNVELTKRLLEAIASYSPGTKFISMSSAAVYGNPKELPIKETTGTVPISPYGHHKLLAEQLCKEYYHQKGIATASLRIFSVYGPGLKKQLFWDIYQKMLGHPVLELYGTGDETRDYIYIDDLLQAIDLVIEKSHFRHHIINLANGEETSICEAAKTLLDAMEISKSIVFNQVQHEGNPLYWRADISSLLALGYVKKVSIVDGLNLYAKWLGKI